MTIGNLAGVARPSAAVRIAIRALHPEGFPTITEAFDDEVMLDMHARLLDEAIETCGPNLGDLREVSMFVLKRLRAASKRPIRQLRAFVPNTREVDVALDNEMEISLHRSLLDEGFEHGSLPDGRLDLRAVSLFVLCGMKGTLCR